MTDFFADPMDADELHKWLMYRGLVIRVAYQEEGSDEVSIGWIPSDRLLKLIESDPEVREIHKELEESEGQQDGHR